MRMIDSFVRQEAHAWRSYFSAGGKPEERPANLCEFLDAHFVTFRSQSRLLEKTGRPATKRDQHVTPR
jgi:hypothetical protein